VHATAPGEDAEHNPTNMRLGSERLEAVRSTHPYLIPVGLWHLHDADPTLSLADREAWALWRENGVHVGVIVTGRPAGWHNPELHAWITTPSLCEPLRLTRL